MRDHDSKHPLGIATMELGEYYHTDGFTAEIPGDDDLDKIELHISDAMFLAQQHSQRARVHYANGHWAEAQSAAAVAQAYTQMAQFYQMRLNWNE